MARAQPYRPRFVDIRIRPPGKEAKPEVRRCDWVDCVAPGECRAPKGPDALREYYWFCPRHASQYNKGWNFFSEMSDDDVRAYQKSAETGHRPTWNMKTNTGGAGRSTGWSAAARKAWDNELGDPFELFGPDSKARQKGARKPKLGRLEERAFNTLGFKERTEADKVRSRYKELVKRFHPDANDGDRTSEDRLQQVIQAYKTLKRAGMA